ncbi:MAG: urease accessory protein UreD [Peptococcaceae bacterium]|nr:urease accessory protein UreD [Peptococcaceae bacterium]
MSENRYGAASRLNLTARRAGNRTVLADVSFTAPFKVAHPFYLENRRENHGENRGENDRMSVTLISASAGIMSGDRQIIDITVKEGAWLEVTSQAFEKIHKMAEGGSARRHTRLTVEKNAALNYVPLPAIPFRDSAFRSETEVRLADASSRFFQSEILSCGRAARGERFEYREHKSLTKIYAGDTLIYSDNAVYVPGETPMEGFCLFEGYTHMGNFLMIHQDISEAQAEALGAAARSLKDGVAGVTRTGYGGYCARALSNGSEPLLALSGELRKILRLL